MAGRDTSGTELASKIAMATIIRALWACALLAAVTLWCGLPAHASDGGHRERSESQSVDVDGDGIEQIDDNCPLLATLDTTDVDGDGVGDACDHDISPMAPRPLLVQAIALSPVVPPPCMTDAVADDAWVTDFRLSDDRGSRSARCDARFHADLVGAAQRGVPGAAAVRDTVAQAITSIGQEAVSYALAQGIGRFPGPAQRRMDQAVLLADEGAQLLVSGSPRGSRRMAAVWKRVASAIRHDRRESAVAVRTATGSQAIVTLGKPECDGVTVDSCAVVIGYTPDTAAVDCDEIGFIQAGGAFDADGDPLFIGTSEERDRRTAAGWVLDRLDGQNSACYGVRNDGTTNPSTQLGGGPTGVTAKMSDCPFITGARRYVFETCAICKSGTDADKILQCYRWGCMLEANGDVRLEPPARTIAEVPANFTDAVAAWNAAAQAPGNKNFGKTVVPPLTPK